MAEKYKTPEELGEAVGMKIEELFSTIVADLPPDEPKPQPPAQEQMKSAPTAPVAPTAPTAPVAPAAPVAPSAPPRSAPVEQRPRVVQAPRQTKPPAKPQPAAVAVSPVASNAQTQVGGSCEELLERIEILVLNLEWEVSPTSVREIFQRFTELERFFSADQSARNILAMNRRVLPQFKGADAVPHRSLLRLLQGSVTALRSIYLSQGRKRPAEELMTAITKSYKEIMSSAPPPPEGVPRPAAGEAKQDGRQRYVSLVENLGGAVRSIDEVNRRLGKILGVLRQGGGMSGEEISRRLGTLEHLIAERVGQLSSFHQELAQIGFPADGPTGLASASQGGEGGPDGLFMLMWGGASLAVPSSMVAAFYPLTRAQAQQFQDKPSIVIGGRTIQKLPLRKPQGAQVEAAQLPAWLIHLSAKQGDFFFLVDRLLGYRKTPKGVDIIGQTRIKIGPTGYILINQTIFR